MHRANPRLTMQPPADLRPGDRPPDRLQQDPQAGPGGGRSPSALPEDVVDTIVRHTIAGNTPRVSALQLALLQRVDRGFNAAAKRVLQSRDQQHVGRETTREKIDHLRRRTTLREFRAGVRSIVSAAPDVGIRLRSLPKRYREAALQVLAEQTHLRSLDIDATATRGMGPRAIEAMQTILERNADLQHAGLNLTGCMLTNDDVRTIAESPGMSRLTALDIGSNAIGDEGAATLAGSAHLSLQSLDLRGSALTNRGVTALAESEMAQSLATLRLGFNPDIDARGVAALANSENLASLTSLELEGNVHATHEGAIALANSQHLRLESLEMGSCRIGDAGVAALARSRMAQSLIVLGVMNNGIGDEGARAIAESDRLVSLRNLDLRHNAIGQQRAAALKERFELVKL